METWNKRLARACEESGKSNNWLATQIGVSAPTFSAWVGAATIKPAETIGAHRLFAICRLLGVRPEWVLFAELPKYRREAWPFSVQLDAIMRLPPDELERLNDLIRRSVEPAEAADDSAAERPLLEIHEPQGNERVAGRRRVARKQASPRTGTKS